MRYTWFDNIIYLYYIELNRAGKLSVVSDEVHEISYKCVFYFDTIK